MVEIQGNCSHCGADLEVGAMFCAECGRPVARSAEAGPKPPTTSPGNVDAAASPEPAKPNLARTMMGVQASQLSGARPGAPKPAAGPTPQGAFAPAAAGAPLIGPPPSSFGSGAFGGVPPQPRTAAQPAPPTSANARDTNNGAVTSGEEPRTTAYGSSANSVEPLRRGPLAFGGATLSGNVTRGMPVEANKSAAGTESAAEVVEEDDEASESEADGGEDAESEEELDSDADVDADVDVDVHADDDGDADDDADDDEDDAAPAPPIAAGAVRAEPSAPAAVGARTLMGVDTSMVGTPAEVIAAERPRRALSKTMLGISPDAALGLQRMAAERAGTASSAEAPANPVPPVAPAPGFPPRSNANPLARTMLGMASPVSSMPPPPAGSAASSAPLSPGAMKNTLQGVAMPGAQSDFAAGQHDRGGMQRTMLGIAPLGGGGGGGGAPPSIPGLPGSAGQSAPMGAGRTMLGLPKGQGEGVSAAAVVSEPRARAEPAPASEDRRTSAPPARREMRGLWPLLAVTLVVVIVTLILVWTSHDKPHVDVSAKIVSTETGEALLFEVPSAPENSKIRFGGQEKALAAGRASFALAADSLRVGDNLVLAEVVPPDGEIAPVRITLAVFYRIWVDTSALRAERAALDVVVTALPTTRVTLDGEDLKLDEAGRGVRTYPIDVVSEAKSGVIEHVVHYRVQPPSGDTVVDELRTRIPVAMMQIDRPGREVLTDRESIEIAGAAGKDTQIHLDKISIPVKDGRFLYRLMLPEPRDYKPRLVASAAGRAPLGVTLSIRRVRDLNQAASQFAAVPDLTYAKVVPNPVIYRGQKISLEGRVYAIDPRGAESVIQMFVRPCPSSRRCPLWVSDPHATDVAVDAWIRVLGVVEGEQQFRSEKNEIVTVPKVEAQFVLPAAP
jgi:hypothetical protein